MSDAVAHTLDGCEVQPLGEELNPEREELLVDMDVVRERGLEIINTTAYIAITGTVCRFKTVRLIMKLKTSVNTVRHKDNKTETEKCVSKSQSNWQCFDEKKCFF